MQRCEQHIQNDTQKMEGLLGKTAKRPARRVAGGPAFAQRVRVRAGHVRVHDALGQSARKVVHGLLVRRGGADVEKKPTRQAAHARPRVRGHLAAVPRAKPIQDRAHRLAHRPVVLFERGPPRRFILFGLRVARRRPRRVHERRAFDTRAHRVASDARRFLSVRHQRGPGPRERGHRQDTNALKRRACASRPSVMHDYPRKLLQPTTLHDGNLPLKTYTAIIFSRATQRLQCQETFADFESDGELDREEESAELGGVDENSAHGPSARRDVAQDRLLLYARRQQRLQTDAGRRLRAGRAALPVRVRARAARAGRLRVSREAQPARRGAARVQRDLSHARGRVRGLRPAVAVLFLRGVHHGERARVRARRLRGARLLALRTV
ncbi:ORF72 [Lymantria xylina nucleopolyhedrovirus]|uniref:ORF72 n=1 Tax=Lymantria xylina multiple nucleopolyhedrovirus TaxID=2847840 RepID=D4N2A9_9ABAC|nr:ORF72 [Lymantria xylina nucleopolyhedrovirus]ADD73781.1 ORF72 [Lymantria xylina nucleopolyhedrovirus]